MHFVGSSLETASKQPRINPQNATTKVTSPDKALSGLVSASATMNRNIVVQPL